MTFKDLQRFVEYQSQITSPPLELQPTHLFTRLRDKQFWYWNRTKHEEVYRLHKQENCYFNHIIGLPTKDGIERPMYDYERLLYDALMCPSFMNQKTAIRSDNGHHRFYANTGKKVEMLSKSSPDIIRYPFKCKHLFVKKATGLGVTEHFNRRS